MTWQGEKLLAQYWSHFFLEGYFSTVLDSGCLNMMRWSIKYELGDATACLEHPNIALAYSLNCSISPVQIYGIDM
jgi:hypothetical protein